MAASQDIVLGIDLGTTYSCAAYVQAGKPRIIPSEKGYATLPSVVGMSRKGEIIVGHAAMDQMVTKPEDTIYGSKRLIGRKFNSLIVQRMREFMTYQIVEGPEASAAVMMGGKLYTLPQIAAFILAEMKETAQRHLQVELRKAVITVPAYYSDEQRHAVHEAGALAGLEVQKIVNEPTAAALAYGYNKGFDQKILVYDLGGGTFDVSILHVHGNEFRVLATGGDTFLGGLDFDNRVTAYVLEKFEQAVGKDIRSELIAMQRVRAAAELAKRRLSNEKTVKMELPFITEVKGEPVDLVLSLGREQLNRLTSDLVERTLTMCDEVLNTVKIQKSDINEILLVGGQTRMPLVQGKVTQHFGKPPRKGVHPDEVVACGAAILGDTSAGATPVKLKDVLSIPIGIALPGGRFKIVMERNMPIPATKAYKVNIPGDKPLEVDVYQGEKATIVDNEYLGTFRFAPDASAKGKVRMVEMRFDLNPEGLLTVRARDLERNTEVSTEMVTLHSPQSMRDGMAAAMQEKDREKGKWFNNLAQRILGKGSSS